MATRKKKTTDTGFLEWLSGLDLLIKIALGAITLLTLYVGINQLQKPDSTPINPNIEQSHKLDVGQRGNHGQ